MQITNIVGATVLFEDPGTNTNVSYDDLNQDPPDTDDAANLNSALRAVGVSNAVIKGMVLSYESTNTTMAATAGIAVLNDDSAFAPKAEQTRQDVCYPVRVPAQAGIQLTPNAVNDIYLHLPLTDNDAAQYVAVVPANDPLPDKPRLHIGSIDLTVATPTPTHVNRGAELNARSLQGPITGDSVLTSLVDGDLTVDGAGNLVIEGTGDSLTNADTLGGQPPSYYAAVSEAETITAKWDFDFGLNVDGDITHGLTTVYDTTTAKVPAARVASGVDAGTYKGNDIDTTGNGQVDSAEDAAKLGGLAPTSYARTDVAETFADDVTLGPAGDLRWDRGRTATSALFWNASATTDNGMRMEIDGATTGFRFTAGGLLETLAGDLTLDAASNIINAAGTLRENGTRVATRTWALNNTIPGTVHASGKITLAGSVGVIATTLTGANQVVNVDLSVDGTSVAGPCKVAGRAFWDEAAGVHKVEIIEVETAIGNPTVNYRITTTTV